ncbi:MULTISPECIES: hypothetical protein [unclassified Mycobacterium]|uniref:hypothetical protein n=1 Tax=unclassified Mycobacterium TaxID=2642494 RepID=UPI00073FE0CB|nr:MULTISPECIES: hypothetical protein [unclassified Mycobacterium]KUH83417.1 hypothetical protein AU185_05005 [Mycobacterium sp. GA-0227b]KUH84451.1 hypothetical protein AU186_21555 [Mycobacterium sp. GA-1999]KUH89425.1 hypothetical protein AU187_09870 [Mycobacterium sp. IS-1556]
MARHADPSAGELNTTEETHTLPTSPDHTDNGSPQSRNGRIAEPKAEDVSAATPDAGDSAPVDGEEDDAATGYEDEPPAAVLARQPMSQLRRAALVAVVMVVALGGLAGWLGFRANESYQTEKQRELFVQVARQGALNLTTIDWQQADADVQRILDSATGTFHDDFAARSQPFVDVVKKVQSKSVGTVTEAGLESLSDDEAQVLVAMSVKTAMPNAPEPQPRSWRMRISVQKVGDDEVKLSNVAFVP